jgi:hypothetical protein
MDLTTQIEYRARLQKLVNEGKISRSSFAYQQVRAALHEPAGTFGTCIPVSNCLTYPFDCTTSIKLALQLLGLAATFDGLTFSGLRVGGT